MTQLSDPAIKKNTNRNSVHNISQYYYIDLMGRIDPDDIINIDDKIKEDISCSVCTYVYNHTIMLDCGHMFCVDCIQKFITNKCPLCRGYFTKTHCIREFDKIIFSKIKDLLVNCVDCENNHSVQTICDKKINGVKRCKFCKYAVTDIITHFKKECEYIIKCKHEICNTYGYKDEIKNHEEMCGHQYIDCETCDDQIKIKNRRKHLKKCVKTKRCEVCGRKIKINDMENHINKKCTKRIVECGVCNKSMPAHKFNHHRKGCNKYFYYLDLYEERYTYYNND